MATLNKKIKLYLEADSKVYIDEKKNYIIRNEGDGNGDYLHSWNVDGLAEPTAEQIASYETAGNAAETNAGIDATRRTEYLSWDKQMEMIYKDQKNGTTTFKDHCDKVRSDNPK